MNDLVVINRTVIEQEIARYNELSQEAYETKQFAISEVCIERVNILEGILKHSAPLKPLLIAAYEEGFNNEDSIENYLDNLKIQL